jgi:DNA-binding CsgD family transcriptional regulator
LNIQPPAADEDLGCDPWVVSWHTWGVVWVHVALARARRLRASNETRALAIILQPVLVYLMRRMSQAEQDGLVHRLVELSILQSLALDALGDRLRALVALERSITLSLPGKYQRVFREQGEAIQFLLEAFRAEAARRAGENRRRKSFVLQDPHASILAHVDFLLAAFPHKEKIRKTRGRAAVSRQAGPAELSQVAKGRSHPQREFQLSPSVQVLGNALTPREIEVLNLLALGDTYQEIAEQLFVSLPTIRWHVRSIYRKLGVSSRGRAVARATELRLL